SRGRDRHPRGDARPARVRAARHGQLRGAAPRPLRASTARRGPGPRMIGRGAVGLSSLLLALVALALGCSSGRHEASAPAPKPPVVAAAPARAPADTTAPAPDSVRRVAPPDVAFAHGWMPLASTAVDRFLRAHPEYDGR